MSVHADVLVVDDEQVVRGAVRKVCTAEGLVVDGAESVDAGLERLARMRYRAVLLDLMLPASGGMRVLEASRRDHPEIPVVMITGYATPESKVECFRGGAFDVLPKPFDANELVAVLRRAMGFAETPGEVPAEHKRAGLFTLGHHSWVRIEEDGTAALGVGGSFRRVLDGMTQIETPAIDGELVQGKRMAVITSRDGLGHRVWSPLGGTVVATNRTCEEDRWLLRIVPTDLENELEQLARM